MSDAGGGTQDGPLLKRICDASSNSLETAPLFSVLFYLPMLASTKVTDGLAMHVALV
jgi:hypothetical protein